MRWLRRQRGTNRRDRPGSSGPDPVVLPVTAALTRATALELARQVQLLPQAAPVVIDLTAIPGFDSEGTELLAELQHADARRSVSIVGMRQAATRLVAEAEASVPAAEAGWVLRRLRNLLVVQPGRPGPASPVGLEAALTAARAHEDAAIVVVDLLDVGELSRSAVDALAFASSHAALEGQELLIVNASVGTADELRAAGLSATTYVAPEPPLD